MLGYLEGWWLWVQRDSYQLLGEVDAALREKTDCSSYFELPTAAGLVLRHAHNIQDVEDGNPISTASITSICGNKWYRGKKNMFTTTVVRIHCCYTFFTNYPTSMDSNRSNMIRYKWGDWTFLGWMTRGYSFRCNSLQILYIYIYKTFIHGRHDTPWMHGVHNPGSDHGSALTVYTWPVTGHAGTSVAEPPAFGPENRSLAWQSGKQKNSDSTCCANYPLVFFTQHGKSHICRWFHLFEYHQFPWLC